MLIFLPFALIPLSFRDYTFMLGLEYSPLSSSGRRGCSPLNEHDRIIIEKVFIMKNNPNVSILIPAYNIEDYIGTCIESCLAQTYSNFEMIIVDDGSTDLTGEICDVYSQKDTRIRVIHQNNLGLASARNNALSLANGKYIIFVDGDDIVAKDLLQIALNEINKEGCDIVFWQFQQGDGRNIIWKETLCVREQVILDSEKCLELLLQRKISEMVWQGIYKTSLIKDIIFPVGRINEDVYWKYKAIENAEKIKIISDNLYFYRVREGSIMRSKFSWKNFNALGGAYQRAVEISQKYPSLRILAYSEVWSDCVSFYNNVNAFFPKEERRKAIKKIYNYKTLLPLTMREIILESRISRMRKYILVLCKLSMKFSAWIKKCVLQYIDR